MSSKSQGQKDKTEKVEKKIPPQPEPNFRDTGFFEAVDKIIQGWVDKDIEGLLEVKADLIRYNKMFPETDLASKIWYYQDDKWWPFATTKNQVMNSNIHMIGLRASRMKAGV